MTEPMSPEVKPWWARWARNADWRDKLHKRAAHKSLDIPEEDVINANRETTVTGMSPLGVVGIALATAIPSVAAIMLAWQALKTPAMLVPQTLPAQPGAVDSEYDVLFYDRNGKPIDVPRKIVPAKGTP